MQNFYTHMKKKAMGTSMSTQKVAVMTMMNMNTDMNMGISMSMSTITTIRKKMISPNGRRKQ